MMLSVGVPPARPCPHWSGWRPCCTRGSVLSSCRCSLLQCRVPIQLSGFSDPVAAAIMAAWEWQTPRHFPFQLAGGALRPGALAEGITWGLLSAGGVLAGIGFTMSLFIAELALGDDMLEAAKIGILAGSAICALIGMILLRWLLAKASVKAEVPCNGDFSTDQ